MNIVKKYYLLFVILLYLIGSLALLGAFVIIEIKNTGVYSREMLSNDLVSAMICAIFPMIYPVFKYVKNKSKG